MRAKRSFPFLTDLISRIDNPLQLGRWKDEDENVNGQGEIEFDFIQILNRNGRILTHDEFSTLVELMTAFYNNITPQTLELLNKANEYDRLMAIQQRMEQDDLDQANSRLSGQDKVTGWIALMQQADTGYYRLGYTRDARAGRGRNNYETSESWQAIVERIQKESVSQINLIQKWRLDHVHKVSTVLSKKLENKKVLPRSAWLVLDEDDLKLIQAELD